MTTNAAADQARVAATRVAEHPVLEALARIGFVGYGVVHLLVAWLGLQIAFGRPAPRATRPARCGPWPGSPSAASRSWPWRSGSARWRCGRPWRRWSATAPSADASRTAERLLSAGRAAAYTYFAVLAAKVVQNAGTSSAESQQAMTARLLATTGGRVLVVVLGVALAGLGAGLVWYGATQHFDKHLAHERMSATMRRVIGRIGTAGYTGKGVAYGIAGMLLASAAVTYDVDKARGLDAALRELAGQPYGAVAALRRRTRPGHLRRVRHPAGALPPDLTHAFDRTLSAERPYWIYECDGHGLRVDRWSVGTCRSVGAGFGGDTPASVVRTLVGPGW